MRNTLVALSLVSLCLAGGCNSSGLNVAPVSGTVTLNGKPLPNAHVTFVPKPGLEAPSSDGTTDANGRYSLIISVTDEVGAAVGEHIVQITASQHTQAPDDDRSYVVDEPVPARYNAQSTLEFTVPPDGTKTADFALKSP